MWLDRISALKGLPLESGRLIESASRVLKLRQGTRLFESGQSPSHFLLLLAGSVRVQQVSESGREIVLYRVAAGENCALTTACLMANDYYRGEGIAETAIEAVAIPRSAFDQLIARAPSSAASYLRHSASG